MPDAFGGLADLASSFFAPAAEAAPAAAGEALNILPDVAAFTPSSIGDIVAPAAVGAATGGLGAGGSGLGGSVGNAFDSLLTGGTSLGFTGQPAASTTSPAPAVDAINAAITPPVSAPTPAPTPTGPASFGGVSTSGGVGSDIVAAPGGGAVTSPGVAQTISAAPGGSTAAAFSAPSGTAPTSIDPTSVSGDLATSGIGTGGDTSGFDFSKLLKSGASSITDAVTKNPIGTALGVGGLGLNIVNSQKQNAALKSAIPALTNEANIAALNNQTLTAKGSALSDTNAATGAQITGQGEALTQYLTNGTLPDAYNQQIDQAINSAKTQAISNAAAQGQPTDPTKNTTLAQELSNIDNQRPGMVTQIANQLFGAGAGLIGTGTGISTSTASSLLGAGASNANLSGELYSQLAGIDQKQTAATGNAIAALAAAMNARNSSTVTKPTA